MITRQVPADRLGPAWPRSDGLTTLEAVDVRHRYGANDIVDVAEHPWGYPLLYLPTHIVWLKMLIHPTALLVFLIFVVGVFLTVLVIAGYVRSFETGDVDHGRAMALGVLTLSSAVLIAAFSRLRTTATRVIVDGHDRTVARPHAGSVPGSRARL